MRLEVDSTAYVSAMELAYDANQQVASSVSLLARSLGGCSAMAGDDSGGRDWALAHDSVAGDLLSAAADLGGAFGVVGNLLNGSLANHDGADCGARISGPPIAATGVGDDDPAHALIRVAPAMPPSAAGGTGSPPDGWHWLADHLEGLIWPNADTARLRAAGEAWQRASESLSCLGSSGESMSSHLGSLRSPEVPVAQDACRELGAHSVELSATYGEVGQACLDYAAQVEEHRHEVLSTLKELLAWTAVDQVTGAVLSFFTAGAAELAAQLAEAGILARFAGRVVATLRRLVELALAAAALIRRGLARVTQILARLKRFLSLKAMRALERVGVSAAGRRVLATLPQDVRAQVDDAISRAAAGKARFAGHDGKVFHNADAALHLPPGNYQEWTAAVAGSRRGPYRVLIEGNPRHPNAIYFWDHLTPPVRIGP